MSVVTLTIDGRDMTAHDGQTLLDVAREHGIDIPTMCHLDGLSDVGACRLCLVAVGGSNKLQPACVTPAAEGMSVQTNTPRLQEYRKMIVELFLAERNHVCSVCVSNGNCELQDMAAKQGVDHVRFDYRFPKLDVDVSHAQFGVDHNRCILCTRCVRVCDEVEGAPYLGRGGPRREFVGYYRSEPTVGRFTNLYLLRQVRASLPDRSALQARRHRRRNEKGQRKAGVPRYRSGEKAMERARLATVWLGGCSGCHMSFLDLDEWLIELAGRADLVYSPLADVKEYPENVDVVLVEGAVANDENLAMICKVRERSKVLVSFGDCAVTGNVTALRNPLGTALEVLRPVYAERGDWNARIPDDREIVPVLLDRVTPVHSIVPVDVYLPGCPPPAGRIKMVVSALLDGRAVELPEEMRRFG